MAATTTSVPNEAIETVESHEMRATRDRVRREFEALAVHRVSNGKGLDIECQRGG